jgi:hypothetical protein
VIRDSDAARGTFCGEFRYALRNAFGETYQKFVALFEMDQRKVEDGVLITIYRLFCHQVAFLVSES